MNSLLARFSCTVAVSAFALAVNAQIQSAPPEIPPPEPVKPATSQPEIPSPPSASAANEQFSTQPAPAPAVEQSFPTPAKPSSADSPQLTTNAPAQALAEYDASRAFCMRQADDKRDACLKEAEEGYHRALRGDNPEMQGNSGSTVGERGTPRQSG